MSRSLESYLSVQYLFLNNVLHLFFIKKLAFFDGVFFLLDFLKEVIVCEKWKIVKL